MKMKDLFGTCLKYPLFLSSRMEVTDVNQLMSLIESGTVSIICDPTEVIILVYI